MLKQLIDQCQRGNAFAQRRLYDQYVNRLHRVSLRYVRAEPDAEEVLMTAFLKIFRSLSDFVYRDDNGFEAWMRRIVVNEALLHLRSNRTLPLFQKDELTVEPVADGQLPDGELDAEQIYEFIRELPPGYRTVFNLYAIEGYTHREIAGQLNISENTSKSQLSKARALLQHWLTTHGYERTARQTS
ncbi:RNA polymerase sigma factor [Fibrivirga algicola]|uniref:Sigma-70 family RNA polymerase sigma factor n=1 Tax=Fibrivirga algicola TaxID=2950420 RepID=A0ABX0QMP8_9BACT|nr:sigma-70 family RNA polymerase sigma factor [Fibrivirga algicola]ARK10359.1 RNA polymerase subunit sigma-24 [Fibrella sp. ES10-3-2-2]NID11868.1 sigma-70 family RNA polymerase sigma factor [Fibrivirga algicola]